MEFKRQSAMCYSSYIGSRAGIAQSVQQLAMGWTAWDSNPDEDRFSIHVQTDPGPHPAS
jgi:hypothetical protein